MISPRRSIRTTLLELAKMRRQRLVLFVLGVPAAIAGLVPQVHWLSEKPSAQGYWVFSNALSLALLLGCFLALLQASASIAWERSEKTLRNYLAGPVQRSEVLLSRWISLELEMLLLLALAVAAAYASTSSRFTFEDIRGEAVEPLFYAREVAHQAVIAILYFVPAAAALVSIGVFASVVCATPAAAAALGLGALLCLDILKSVFSSKPAWTSCLFNSYLPTLFDQTSYLYGVAKMAQGINDELWPDAAPQHWLVWLIPAGTTLASAGLALWIFVRRDYVE